MSDKKKLLRISALEDDHICAGLEFRPEPTDYAIDHFTGKQLTALVADPLLLVQEYAEGDLTTAVVLSTHAQS